MVTLNPSNSYFYSIVRLFFLLIPLCLGTNPPYNINLFETVKNHVQSPYNSYTPKPSNPKPSDPNRITSSELSCLSSSLEHFARWLQTLRQSNPGFQKLLKGLCPDAGGRIYYGYIGIMENGHYYLVLVFRSFSKASTRGSRVYGLGFRDLLGVVSL